MARMDGLVRVKREVFDQLLAEARAYPNIECCGLLAGRDEVISVVLSARNALQSASAYEIGPEELFGFMRRMRSEGLQHLGIYHSHLANENTPSRTDIDRAFYPGIPYVIVSPNATVRPIRAFRIVESRAHELALAIV
jgi:proteasome lid subunit RPN8/RPN11